LFQGTLSKSTGQTHYQQLHTGKLTIRNTFRTAGFERQETISTVKDGVEEIGEVTINSAFASTNDDPLKNLDLLLSHVTGGGEHVSASEFVKLDEENPVFNEWDNNAENLLTIEDVHHNQDDTDDEMI
jgi:hypothetical protein